MIIAAAAPAVSTKTGVSSAARPALSPNGQIARPKEASVAAHESRRSFQEMARGYL